MDISKQTIEILTNKELIALNQDKKFYQARSIKKEGQIEIWEKLLFSRKKKAIAMLNREDKATSYVLEFSSIGLSPKKKIRDL